MGKQVNKKIMLLVADKDTGIFAEKLVPRSIMKTLLEHFELPKLNSWKQQLEADKKKAEDMYKVLSVKYPELIAYKKYFSKNYQNNAYISIMKQGIIHYIKTLQRKDKRFNSYLAGHVLGLSASMVDRHFKIPDQKRHLDYNEVVVIMDKMIKKNLYPFSKINTKTLLTEYVWEELKNGL